jgi:hypothetical protein
LGHSNSEVVEHLNESVTGARLKGAPSTVNCETYSVSNAKHIISRRPYTRATNPYEGIHLDLVEMTIGYNGDRLFLHFLCDQTGMNHIYTLPSKTQDVMLRTIQDFVTFIHTRYSCTIGIIRMDGETSLGNQFKEWIADTGITVEKSALYTPAQNGSVERSGGVIIQTARCMRIHARLPEDLWPEIV